MREIPFWIIIMLCVVQTLSVKAGSRSARFYDTRNYHISSADRMNLTKYNFCNTGKNMIGACLEQTKCAAEGGDSMGLCKSSTEVCCQVVKMTCSDSTSSHVVRFQNPSFPKNETVGKACTLKINIGKDVCAMRMDIQTFEMTSYKKDLCPHDSFVVIGTKKLAANLCGNMTSTMTSFEVEPFSTLTLSAVAQGIHPYRFSILLTMVPCEDISPIRSSINAGMKNVNATKYTTTSTTTQKTVVTKGTTLKPAKREDKDSPTPLPVGKIKVKPPQESVIARTTIEGQNEIDIEYDAPTPDSLFKEIFDSKIQDLNEGQKVGIPSPESIIREDGEKCYLYDPATGQYRVNEACAIEHHNQIDKWRIIGGKLANINEYPWQVALIYNKKFFCGGSLISKKHIITASHCVFGSFKGGLELLTVSIGDHDMSTKEEAKNQLLKVKRIIWNLHYNPLTTENDIALLELEKPVQFSAKVLPINLPIDYNENFAGKNVTVTGWGRHSIKSRKMSPILKEFTGPVENIDNCVKRWQKYPKISAIKEMHLCLNITYGTPCHGDSGGPLVSCNDGPYCTLAGLVSFGFPLCANVGLPAVFTRVTSFMRWIEINMTPIYF